MPSISAADLKSLEDRVKIAERDFQTSLQDNRLMQARVVRFDDILDKIERAARGFPIDNSNSGTAVYNGYSEHRMDNSRLTDSEKQEMVIDGLWNRNGELSCQIAAVIAIAQFAKEHKA